MYAGGVGELAFIDGIMDKIVYLEILKNNLQKSAINVGLGLNFIFQQDNDPKHTAKIVKLYLLYHCKKELHTPPQSPDLNVIENVWSQLEKSVHEHAITSKEDLKNVLKEEWTKLTVETTKKLVESMPKRIPLTENHRWLRLQWAHQHGAWQADWHQVVFSDEPRLNLWDYDGRIRVRHYAGERYLPECVIERRSCLTPGVII
ncbi:transposable element Tcb2 transposase [Trichonephila clavipes]|nr:transposable element Tcb2 transposase [Trichonephila clavipes]